MLATQVDSPAADMQDDPANARAEALADMRFTTYFRDSDLVRFAHEPCRRGEAADAGMDPQREEWMRLLRSSPTQRDKTLSQLALAWREHFPPESRPLQLCEHYARVANKLALCWEDPALTELLLMELLNDRRGTRLRKGFPPPVLRELNALHDLTRLCRNSWPETTAEPKFL
jgi:hypothetical protein